MRELQLVLAIGAFVTLCVVLYQKTDHLESMDASMERESELRARLKDKKSQKDQTFAAAPFTTASASAAAEARPRAVSKKSGGAEPDPFFEYIRAADEKKWANQFAQPAEPAWWARGEVDHPAYLGGRDSLRTPGRSARLARGNVAGAAFSPAASASNGSWFESEYRRTPGRSALRAEQRRAGQPYPAFEATGDGAYRAVLTHSPKKPAGVTIR